jgi:hypothetical protein
MGVDGGGALGSGDYVVGEAEGVSRIAQKSGHFWHTIWHHPKNAELRRNRSSPEVLSPGDVVFVPPLRPSVYSRPTGQRHTFRRRGIPAHIVINLRDRGGKPFAGCRYVLQMGEEELEGTTDEMGRLQHFADPACGSATLTLWPARPLYPTTLTWQLRVSALDPVDTMRGARARLANLGLPCGDGQEEDDALRDAVTAFQHREGLPVTGRLDDTTRRRLLEAHGS